MPADSVLARRTGHPEEIDGPAALLRICRPGFLLCALARAAERRPRGPQRSPTRLVGAVRVVAAVCVEAWTAEEQNERGDGELQTHYVSSAKPYSFSFLARVLRPIPSAFAVALRFPLQLSRAWRMCRFSTSSSGR